MSTTTALLALIPARAGSKGLPGKNIRPFMGLPLIAHSIRLAGLCPEIDRTIVSTDSPDVAETAKRFGADVPFIRPAELAQDDTPLWPVIRHALALVEEQDSVTYDALLLLDPTSPGREPADVAGALRRLEGAPDADGIIGVSEPHFNPVWNCVVERDGWMSQLIEAGGNYDRRQELPKTYRIHGSLYIWRAAFVRAHEGSWRKGARYLMYETPESRSMSIDTAHEFNQAECLVRNGLISFPWLSDREAGSCAR